EAAVEDAATRAALIVLTRGAAGCTLYAGGARMDVPAFPALERDTIGAGDIFATALFVRLAETGDMLTSARFAACAAACAVEGHGWKSIPDRAQVLARLGASLLG